MPKTVGEGECLINPTEVLNLLHYIYYVNYSNYNTKFKIMPLCLCIGAFYNESIKMNGNGGEKMAKIEQKQVVVNEIKEKAQKAISAVLVDARGLSVSQDTELRKSLREAGVDYKVYKNTMMHLALKDTQFEPLEEYLKGPSAIAFCYEDSTKAASLIKKASKEFKAIEFKAGVVENTLYDAEGITAIADIPSREELLAKLLGSMKSPISSFARVLDQVAQKKAE